MQSITGTGQFQIEEPTVVTIGKFDGRHKGHQKLLRTMLDIKEKHGWKTAVFSFDMVPAGIVSGKPQTVITTNQERRNNLENMGIDYLVEYPFTQEVSHMAPEDFVKKILAGQMNARAIVAGTDCGFGYQRTGNAALLKELAARYGYEAVIIEKEQADHRDISSTYIKEELNAGHIEKVNTLLGEPYAIHGIVVHGNHIGSSILGFPTANIHPPEEKHLPPYGVYVSRVLIDGAFYGGVTNIGKKPTVEGEYPVGVETFIMGLDGDLYGKRIEVQLLHFERPEQKFASLELLKEQIEQDKQSATTYFAQHPEYRIGKGGKQMSVERVKTYLRQWNLQDQVLEFDVSSATVELAAQAVGCEGCQIAKTMSFLVDGKAVLVVMAGDARIDNRKFKDLFHTKATMIRPEEVETYIGHPIGGVCPFDIKDGVDVYLDQSMKRFEAVYPAAGSASSAVKLTLPQLETASRCKGWIEISKDIQN